MNQGGGALFGDKENRARRLNDEEFKRMYLQTALGVNWLEHYSSKVGIDIHQETIGVVCGASSIHRCDGLTCDGTLDFKGEHAISGCLRTRHGKHEQAVRALVAVATIAEMAPSRQHIAFDGKHKADLAVHGLTEDTLGITTYLDATVRNINAVDCPLDATGQRLDVHHHLRLANAAKRSKYADMASAAGVDFIPVEISTSGLLGGGARLTLGGMADRISKKWLMSFSSVYVLARSALVGATMKAIARNLLRMDNRIKQFYRQR